MGADAEKEKKAQEWARRQQEEMQRRTAWLRRVREEEMRRERERQGPHTPRR